MTALVTQLVPRLDHARSIVEAVVLEQVELEVEGAVLGVGRIRVIPLLRVSANKWTPNAYATYLQVLRSAIPDVHSLEIRIITIVEGAPISVELVRKD